MKFKGCFVQIRGLVGMKHYNIFPKELLWFFTMFPKVNIETGSVLFQTAPRYVPEAKDSPSPNMSSLNPTKLTATQTVPGTSLVSREAGRG